MSMFSLFSAKALESDVCLLWSYAWCQDLHYQGHHAWSTTAMQIKKKYYAPRLMEIVKTVLSAATSARDIS
jgi:hypothetical protein